MLSAGRLRMLQTCRDRGWNCVDASQALLTAVHAGQTVYYADDPHLNVDGNAVVARLMANYLKPAVDF